MPAPSTSKRLSSPPEQSSKSLTPLSSGIIALGAGLWHVSPNHRPFTLTDPSISFPYVVHEKISTATLFLVTVVAPLVLTAVISLLLPPATSSPLSRITNNNRALTWRRKLWAWHAAWLGLALSFALSFLFVQGMKNLFGKPRPDLLSRCDPDFENQANYQLGGYPQVLNGFYLVSSTICRQKDKAKLDDGFSSFPSGHATYSWAGMLFLALFLASRFGFAIPYLPFTSNHPSSSSSATTANGSAARHPGSTPSPSEPAERSAAAPPLVLFLLPLIPVCIATYISSTRFSDFRHHPFDIIFGSLMGTAFSLLTFRLYHMPVRRGGGGSWGPRNSGAAFGLMFAKRRELDERKRTDEVAGGDVELGKVDGSAGEGRLNRDSNVIASPQDSGRV
ncbi:MAG: hypothetical protein LQ338_006310 [Usnochroma carphineum]|nr:MAG: hypothetical protein LQ338_006310 [Usnochroma carphineum]